MNDWKPLVGAVIGVLSTLAATLIPVQAQAQYPNKTIRMVVTYPTARANPDKLSFGSPGFDVTAWFAIFAPAGTPRDIITRLNAETLRIYKLPDVAERLKTLGLDAVLSSPEELGRVQAAEVVKWARVVKESGAKAE